MSESVPIIDASALLAAMLGEPGAEIVAPLLADARVSAVNLAEVIAKLQERGVPEVDIDESLADLDLDIVPFDASQARHAGLLRASTRKAGLSLGDRACLALAIDTGGIAITADAAWSNVDTEASIRLIR